MIIFFGTEPFDRVWGVVQMKNLSFVFQISASRSITYMDMEIVPTITAMGRWPARSTSPVTLVTARCDAAHPAGNLTRSLEDVDCFVKPEVSANRG